MDTRTLNPPNRKTAYSCVVDKDPDFFFQSLYLIASLLKLADVNPSDIFIHLIEGTDPSCAEVYRALGLHTVWIKPFDERAPYCNKITQLRTPEFNSYEQIILCDCDIAFKLNVEHKLPQASLAAKTVDLANPPLAALEHIVATANLPPQSRTKTTFQPAAHGMFRPTGELSECLEATSVTLKNNCNGGLYVISTAILERLREEWKRQADWLLERIDLLGEHRNHVDQVAFALATWKTGISVNLLDTNLNFPTHLPLDSTAHFSPPDIIHFHRAFDDKGHLRKTGIDAIDSSIAEIEAAHQLLLHDISKHNDASSKVVTLKRLRWLEWNNSIAVQPLCLPRHMENELPLIAIETIGQCQYTCSYCPVSVTPKRKGRLELEDIRRIISEILPLDGQFQIRFHFYNEPTLDNRLEAIISFARKKLPNTYMRLVTNGDLLDTDRIDAIFSAGINQIAVSCHQKEVFDRLSEIVPALDPKRDIELRPAYQNSVWSNRLSAVDLTSQGYTQATPAGVKPWGCSFLTAQIDFQGNVHACCEDFHGKLIQGNIRDNTLHEIQRAATSWKKQTYCGFYTGVCRKCAGIGTSSSAAMIAATLKDAGQ